MLGGVGLMIAQLRTGARGLRTSTATVTRQGEGVPDGLGGVVYGSSTVWTGLVHIETAVAAESTEVSAGDVVTTQRLRVDFPVDAGPFKVGDIVEITQSRYASHLVGTKYRILASHDESLQTGLRVPVELHTSGG